LKEDYRRVPGLLPLTKSLIKKHRIKAIKQFGQNFLVDDFIRVRIIDTASLSKKDTVLEIGAGLGALTVPLAERAGQVIALEHDKRFCLILEELVKDYPNVKIINGDALQFDYRSPGESYKVVANLPYSISTPLLMKLFENRKNISQMVLMFQKEIADRLTAYYGTRDYGFLSVIAQFYADVHTCFIVKKDSFFPSPKVDSAVVRLRMLARPRVEVQDETLFFRLARASMAYKRKNLKNNLKRAGDIINAEQLDQVLQRTGIDPKRRGETLTLSEFAVLANTVSSLGR